MSISVAFGASGAFGTESVYANTGSTEAARPLVIDNASILSSQEEQMLSDHLSELSAQYSCEIVVLTVSDTGGKTPESFSNDYFDTHNYGSGSNHDGMMLMLSMSTRDYWIVLNGIPNLAFSSKSVQSKLMDDGVMSSLKDGNYYSAFSRFADNTGAGLSAYVKKASQSKLSQAALPALISLVASLLVGGLLSWLIAAIRKRKHHSVLAQSGAGAYLKSNGINKDERTAAAGAPDNTPGIGAANLGTAGSQPQAGQAISSVLPSVGNISAIPGLAAGLGALGLSAGLNNISPNAVNQFLNLTMQNDSFLYSNVTSMPIITNTGSGGGIGGIGGGRGGFGGKF